MAALAALSWVGARPDPTGAAPKSTSVAARVGSPAVAILVGEPLGTTTELHFVADDVDTSLSEASLGAPVAKLAHLRGAAVAAVTSPDAPATVFAVADVVDDDKDLSFGASLFRLRAGESPKALADRVVHASHPIVGPDGKILVARGEVGPDPGAGVPRVDVLWIDAIDPDTRDARTLLSAEAYLLYVIGTSGPEMLVYRVAPGGSDFVAVDLDTKKVRVITAHTPNLARDFSLDPEKRVLTFTDKPSGDDAADLWAVTRIDLKSNTATELHRGPSMALVPFALPGGDVLVTLDPAKGASTLFGPPLPLGQGVAHVAELSSDGVFVTGVTNLPGELGRPYVLDLKTKTARFVHVPPGSRAIVAGFVPGVAPKELP